MAQRSDPYALHHKNQTGPLTVWQLTFNCVGRRIWKSPTMQTTPWKAFANGRRASMWKEIPIPCIMMLQSCSQGIVSWFYAEGVTPSPRNSSSGCRQVGHRQLVAYFSGSCLNLTLCTSALTGSLRIQYITWNLKVAWLQWLELMSDPSFKPGNCSQFTSSWGFQTRFSLWPYWETLEWVCPCSRCTQGLALHFLL